jgi:tetratricopeptide (TPR) repeat protein
MPSTLRARPRFASASLLILCGSFAALGCGEAPPVPDRPMPPSASDLNLLKSAKLCDQRSAFLSRRAGGPVVRDAWGSGEEARIPSTASASGGEESYFFDENGQLVGVMLAFPSVKDLKPFPILRETLGQLKSVTEFYLSHSQVKGRASLDATALYETGDDKTTTRYLVVGRGESAGLLMASTTIDPYAALLNPYRKQFLVRLKTPDPTTGGPRQDSQGYEDKESFLALQQFARGETAQLGYCGGRQYDVAADAYKKSLDKGFSDKLRMAEAHHKYGLALEGLGRYADAKKEIQESLALRPNVPEAVNNLGDVLKKAGDRENALKAFEKAVVLRPNYPIARFNLAEMYEAINPKLSISEYETYLALVEGIEEEKPRAELVKKRIKALRR